MLLLACGGGGGTDAGAEADAGESDGGSAHDAGPPISIIVRPDDQEACADREPLRRPYFGDLHVHSQFSFDARIFGVSASPADAYRFAKGEEVALASDGAPRRGRLSRPLDFAAVTDHAEYFAEMVTCWDPEEPGYDSRTCRSYREGDSINLDFGDITAASVVGRRTPVCRNDLDGCLAISRSVWGRIVEAAEDHDDRSSRCEFTTFNAYEWTGTTRGNAIHRNVIFRNATTPAYAASFFEAPTPEDLWDYLDAACIDTDTNCDALAIPHDSNLGGGFMFAPIDARTMRPYTREQAARRARLEPLVEITQYKGSSECLPPFVDPFATDEECAHDLNTRPRCTGGPDDSPDCSNLCGDVTSLGFFCVAPEDYVRPTLLRGLAEAERVGVDPFRFGLIGSTDTHKALPGGTDEEEWLGHAGGFDTDDATRLGLTTEFASFIDLNPGGLAVLWAEENSRDALFDAMRRRESYATSGHRPVLRVFGGWSYPTELCDDVALVEEGYAGGVPMGGELPPREGEGAPRLVISALRDVRGHRLERIQVIKGWHGADGPDERVYDVAGEVIDPAAEVDLGTCETRGSGSDALCTVWEDPDFDPDVPAFYYVRLLDAPSCRWHRYICAAEDVDCDAIDEDDLLWQCCAPDPRQPSTQRERAWSSPIWYAP